MAEENDIIVTRHSAMAEWLRKRGITGKVIPHITPEDYPSGANVYGVFPIHIAEELLRRGNRVFITLLPNLPPELRGKELDLETLERLGVEVREIVSLTTKPVNLDGLSSSYGGDEYE